MGARGLKSVVPVTVCAICTQKGAKDGLLGDMVERHREMEEFGEVLNRDP
jgi:hypothetical protein